MPRPTCRPATLTQLEHEFGRIMRSTNDGPNCTAYLIWYHLTRGNYTSALDHYIRDSDKVPSCICYLDKDAILAGLDKLGMTDE